MYQTEKRLAPHEPADLQLVLNQDEVMTAYLELALRIYLRLKSEGQPIHNCGWNEFDDDSRSVVPSPDQRSSPLPINPN
jgi:hypothetical protein